MWNWYGSTAGKKLVHAGGLREHTPTVTRAKLHDKKKYNLRLVVCPYFFHQRFFAIWLKIRTLSINNTCLLQYVWLQAKIFSSASIIRRLKCMPPQQHCMCPQTDSFICMPVKILDCVGCVIVTSVIAICWHWYELGPEANKVWQGQAGNWFQLGPEVTGSSWSNTVQLVPAGTT